MFISCILRCIETRENEQPIQLNNLLAHLLCIRRVAFEDGSSLIITSDSNLALGTGVKSDSKVKEATRPQ